MPNTGYDETDEARRRAEEKARRRAELQKQIDNLNKEKSLVVSQINGLENEKRNLETYLGMWETQKAKYKGNNLLVEVVIVNLFEGKSADKVKDSFSAGIKEMDQTYLKVDILKMNVIKQIDKLNQYISDINDVIRVLIQEKNAI